MYSSKQLLSCFYCEWTRRRDKATEHKTTEKTRTITGDHNDTDKCDKQRQANVIILSPPIPISTALTTNTITSSSISTSPSTSVQSTPSNLSTSSSPIKNLKSPNSIQDQLILITKQLSKITGAIENIHLEKANKEPASFTQTGDMEQLFESIKCSDDLFMLKSLEINNHLDTITCISCSTWKKQAPQHLLTSIKSSFGIFQYIEQKPDEPLSQRFRNLKINLKLHFSNKLHIWFVREQEERKQAFEDFLKKNEKAGLNVGRATLFCIRSGLGGLKYQEVVVLFFNIHLKLE